MCKWKSFAQGSHRKRAGATRTALRLTVVLCFHAVLFLVLLGLHLALQSWLCNFHHIIESFDYYFTGYFFCAPFSKIENTRMLGCMVLLHHLMYHFLPFLYMKIVVIFIIISRYPHCFYLLCPEAHQCKLSQKSTHLFAFFWKSLSSAIFHVKKKKKNRGFYASSGFWIV